MKGLRFLMACAMVALAIAGLGTGPGQNEANASVISPDYESLSTTTVTNEVVDLSAPDSDHGVDAGQEVQPYVEELAQDSRRCGPAGCFTSPGSLNSAPAQSGEQTRGKLLIRRLFCRRC